MAQVKFNKGLLSQHGSNQDDAIAFLAKDATHQTGKDFGYIYLGGFLAATKYLKEMDLTGFNVPYQEIGESPDITTVFKDSLISIGHSGGSLDTISSYGVDNSQLVGRSGYDPQDDSIMTAAGVAAFVLTVAPTTDIYHGTGTWGGTSSPFTYTAKCYNRGTEVSSGGTNYVALAFTLPVTTSNSVFDSTDDYTLTTPAAVAQYLSTLAGAMDYKGPLTAAIAGGTHADEYKKGDVFIASEAISSIGAESGDMVIVKAAIAANTAFSSSNCDVFERNLDGAVEADANLVTNQLIVGSANNKHVQSLSLGGGSMIYGAASGGTVTELVIGSNGKYLKSTGSAPQWADYYELSIAAASGTGATGIDLTLYKNGSIISAAETYHGMAFNASGKLNIPISASSATTASYAGKVQMSENGSESKILVQGSAGTGSYTSYYDVNYETSATITGDGTIKGKDVKIIDTGTTYVNVSNSILWHDLGS